MYPRQRHAVQNICTVKITKLANMWKEMDVSVDVYMQFKVNQLNYSTQCKGEAELIFNITRSSLQVHTVIFVFAQSLLISLQTCPNS